MSMRSGVWAIVAGLRIVAVLAELTTVVPVRFASKSPRATFTKDIIDQGDPVQMTTEDLASVLLRFENGAKGCFTVGQVLPGHKNDLQLEWSGRSASLRWDQERQNELRVGRTGQYGTVIVKDPALLNQGVSRYAHLPAGHQEGWSDAFCNVIADAYAWIKDGGVAERKPASTATFDDGYRNHCIIDAMVDSHRAGGVWQPVYS